MQVKSRKATLLSTVLYAIFCIQAVTIIYLESTAASKLETFYAQQTFSDNARREGKGLLELITLGAYDGQSQEIRDLHTLRVGAEAARTLAQALAWSMFLASVVLVAWQAAVNRRRGTTGARQVVLHLLAISLICFAVGIATPVLSLLVATDVPGVDQVVVKHEIKSVLSTIGALLQTGNAFVAILLVLFSIVIPLAKAAFTLILLASADGLRRQRINTFLKLVGKWSMADVFVVAIFLAFLALDRMESTNAEPGIGLYFFAWYCLASLATTTTIVWLVKGDQPRPLATAKEAL